MPDDDLIEAVDVAEEFEAMLKCIHCAHAGNFKGYSNPAEPKLILFVCPNCKAIERVNNPFA